METRRIKRVNRVIVEDSSGNKSVYPSITITKVKQESEYEICVLCFKFKINKLPNLEYQWLHLIPILSRLLALPSEVFDPLSGQWICEECERRVKLMGDVLIQIDELQLRLESLKDELQNSLQSGSHELLSQPDRSVFAKALDFRKEIRRLASFTTTKRGLPGSSNHEELQSIPVHGDSKLLVIDGDEPPTTTAKEDDFEYGFVIDFPQPCDGFGSSYPEVEEVLSPNSTVNVKTSRKRKSQPLCDYWNPVTKKCMLDIKDPRKLEAHRRSHQLTIKLIDALPPDVGRSDVAICPAPQCGGKRVLHQYFPKHMLVRHSKLVCNHSIPSNGRESICEEIFDTLEELDVHRDCHLPPVPCVIPDCDEEVKISCLNKHVLENHQLTLCNFRKKDSSRCLQVFANASEVEQHTKFDHHLTDVQPKIVREVVHPDMGDDRLSCGICGSQLLKKSEFAFHVSCHGYYVCLEKIEGSWKCLSYFATQDLLAAHLQSQHPHFTEENSEQSTIAWKIKKPVGVCRICGKTGLIEWDQLEKHLRVHKSKLCCGEDPKTGNKCRKYYETAEQLTAHSLRCSLLNPRQNVDASEGFYCMYCQRTMRVSSRETVEDHVKAHNAFICNYIDNVTQEPCYHTELSEIFMRCHQDMEHFNIDADADTFSVSSEPSYQSKEQLLSAVISNTNTSTPPAECLGNSFVCKHCGKEFRWEYQEIKKHIRSHGGFVCDIILPETDKPCQKIFDDIFLLTNHSRKDHTKVKPADAPYKCRRCPFTSQTAGKSAGHKCRREHFPNPSICEQCGKSYARPKALREHTAMVHGGDRKFFCEECGKGFQLSRLLIYHKRSFHGTGIVVCEICGAPCTTYNIRSHVATHNTPTVECPDCGKLFPSKQICHTHRKWVHGERKYACQECPWRFTAKCMLEKHVRRVHAGLRPFTCEICGAAMKARSHYRDHMKKHEQGLIGENSKFRQIARRVKTPPPDVYNPSFVPKSKE